MSFAADAVKVEADCDDKPKENAGHANRSWPIVYENLLWETAEESNGRYFSLDVVVTIQRAHVEVE